MGLSGTRSRPNLLRALLQTRGASCNSVFHTRIFADKRGSVNAFGKVERESGAFAEFGRDRHFAAVEESKVLHNRESETGAAHISRPGAVDAVETLEHSLQVLGRNPIAVVTHQDHVARA